MLNWVLSGSAAEPKQYSVQCTERGHATVVLTAILATKLRTVQALAQNIYRYELMNEESGGQHLTPRYKKAGNDTATDSKRLTGKTSIR